MCESGATVNDTLNIHWTDPTSRYHCIIFSGSKLKIPLHINGTFSFFHTRRTNADELQSCEKIFITPDCQHWNPYHKYYELNDRSILNYEGEITQENLQEHHLVDHDMDDVNVASIRSTVYNKHIENRTGNSYCATVYNIPSNPDSEFVSDINQRAETSKIMWSKGSVTKSYTPCEFFSDPIIGQLEELEGHICDILCPKSVSQVKANTRAVQATRVKEVNNIQLSKIWIVYE